MTTEHDYYEEITENARTTLEVGQIWTKYPTLPEGHPNRQTIEIRGFVDDRVVFRFWMAKRGYFGYDMESLLTFGFDLDPERHRKGAALQKAEHQDWRSLGVPEEALKEG